MGGARYPEEIRKRSLALIAEGKSYAQIQEKYDVPKSTLSTWLKNSGKKPDRSKQLAHLCLARIASAKAKRKQKRIRIEEALSIAKETASHVPIDQESVGKALLAMLYWAEGGKRDGCMKFTNTDPELILVFIFLLRRHYQIDESRFRVGLQVHYYHNQNQTREFWSKKLQIPVEQFWKIYLKPRGGKKKDYKRNFYGICNLHYSSSAIQRELIALGQEISSRIERE